jgi:hypothetical protein
MSSKDAAANVPQPARIAKLGEIRSLGIHEVKSHDLPLMVAKWGSENLTLGWMPQPVGLANKLEQRQDALETWLVRDSRLNHRRVGEETDQVENDC